LAERTSIQRWVRDKVAALKQLPTLTNFDRQLLDKLLSM
jgi:hypothetical protein